MPALSAHLRSWLRWANLRRLAPDRLFFGPVFGVQMSVTGRQRGTYVVRFLYAAVMCFIAFVTLAGTVAMLMERRLDSGGSAATLQQLQSIAPGLVTAVGIFQFCALTLLGPVSLGPSLGDERRSGSLSALLTSPLWAVQIVCSRLGAQMVQMLILSLIATPLLLAVRVFGGVPAGAIVGFAILSITTAMVGAALSMRLSLGVASSIGASVSALMLQLFLWLGPAIVTGTLVSMGLSRTWAQYFLLLTPPAGVGILVAEVNGGRVPAPLASAWYMPVLVNLLIAGAVVLDTSWRLRRMLNVAPETLGQRRARRARDRAAARRGGEAGGSPETEAERIKARTREVGDDPVLWRELRQGVMSGRFSGLILYGAMICLLVYLYFRVGIDEEVLQLPVSTIIGIMALASGIGLPAGSIAGERMTRTWDVLCTTPMSARQILRAKLVGILRRMWLFPAVLMTHLVISAMAGATTLSSLLLVPMTLLPAMMLQACAGLWISACQESPSKAARLSLGVWVGLWLVTPLLLVITAGGALGSALDPVEPAHRARRGGPPHPASGHRGARHGRGCSGQHLPVRTPERGRRRAPGTLVDRRRLHAGPSRCCMGMPAHGFAQGAPADGQGGVRPAGLSAPRGSGPGACARCRARPRPGPDSRWGSEGTGAHGPGAGGPA